MDSLPASALKVIGQYLDPHDAFSCRLAARCLAPVIASQLTTSQIRVVANSFQLQLQQEDNTFASTSSRTAATVTARAAAAAPAAQVDPTTQRLAQLLIVSKDPDRQNAPTAAATSAEGGADTSSPTLTSRTEGGDDTSRSQTEGVHDTSSPTLRSRTEDCNDTSSPPLRSRTAASLARAAAAGYSKAIVFVDVQQKYTKQTCALLHSSSSIAALTIVEYSSNCLRRGAKKIMKLRRMRTDMAAATDGPWGPAAAAAAAAGAAKASTAGSSSWLLALVSVYSTAGNSPALVHLELQLPAPLEPYVQPMLLELTGLKTLELHPTRVWPQAPPDHDHPGPCEPVLRPCVIEGLTNLSNLKSLTCCVAAAPSVREDAKLAVMLQRTFSDLGGQLTHLSFGTSSRSTQIQLSAPLVSMYDLRSLICQPGFTLDTDGTLESLSDRSATASSSSTSSSPRFQIAPSLTKLVLNKGEDNNKVLGMLVGKGLSAAAAATVRTQLVHLELKSHHIQRELPVEVLSQLAGLRHLNTVIEDKHDLKVLSKSPLTSQLHGLTLLCKQPGQQNHEWCFKFCPVSAMTAFTSLRSLAIIGTQHSIHMDVYLDLRLLCKLKDLQHLTLRCPSRDDLPQYLTGFVKKLPGALQSLSLDLSGRSPGDVLDTSHLKFSKAAFPATLTALKFKEFFVELVDQDPMESLDTALSTQTASASAGNPPGKPAATASSKDGVCSTLSGADGSSSSNHNGLAGLLELSAEFYSTIHATNFLRHCPSLQQLELSLPDHANLQMHTDDLDACANSAALQLSLCCSQLRSLRLTLTVYNPWDNCNSCMAVDELFDIVWPGITDIIGLQSLAISTAGSLSYNKIVACLSSLSCLARLRDLGLQFKLDVTDIGYLDEQQLENEQAQHAATTTTLQSETEQPPTEAHRGRDMCGPLLSAMQGCTGLRRLVLDAPVVTMDEKEEVVVAESLVTMHQVERCFGDSSTVVKLHQRLQNCLVLGSDHHEHQSSSSTLYYR